jgi:uncharacterized protein (DUF2267 family)
MDTIMPSDEPSIPFDLEFLLRAANYAGGPDAPHSDAARKAVDVIAQRLLEVSDLQLRVMRERIKGKDPAELAAEEDGRPAFATI